MAQKDIFSDALNIGGGIIEGLTLLFQGQDLLESSQLATQQREALQNVIDSGAWQEIIGLLGQRAEEAVAGTDPFSQFAFGQAIPTIGRASNSMLDALATFQQRSDALRASLPGFEGTQAPSFAAQGPSVSQGQASPGGQGNAPAFDIEALLALNTPPAQPAPVAGQTSQIGEPAFTDIPTNQEVQAPARRAAAQSADVLRLQDLAAVGINVQTPAGGGPAGRDLQIESRPNAVKRTPIRQPFVGSFQQGTPFVQETGLAQVHRGEAIVPKAQNPLAAPGAFPAPAPAPAPIQQPPAGAVPGPGLAPTGAPAGFVTGGIQQGAPAIPPPPVQQQQKGGGPAVISDIPFAGQPPPVAGSVPVTPPPEVVQAALIAAAGGVDTSGRTTPTQDTVPPPESAFDFLDTTGGDTGAVTTQEATDIGLQSFLDLLAGGGPIGPEEQAIMGQQARDTAELQRQETDRAIREVFGARGLGDSALQDFQRLQNQLSTDTNVTQALNQIQLTAATQNFEAMQGVSRDLVNAAVQAHGVDILEDQGNRRLALDERLGVSAISVADAQVGIERDRIQVERDRLIEVERQFDETLGVTVTQFTEIMSLRIDEFAHTLDMDSMANNVLVNTLVIRATESIANLIQSSENITRQRILDLVEQMWPVGLLGVAPDLDFFAGFTGSDQNQVFSQNTGFQASADALGGA